MEFFEKAHVVKRDDNTDNNMKKQLKQMLYGYKQNDNQLIRNAANVENEAEDSTSVSGFSDLNLTASSSEDNSTRQRISFIDPSMSLDDSYNNQSHLDSSVKFSEASLSDLEDDIKSLSEVSLVMDDSHSSEESDDHFSMTSTSVDPSSDVESSENEPFDYDGKLASKIFEKLKLKDPKKSESKRKSVKKPEMHSEEFSQMESDYSSVELQSYHESDRDSESSINYTNVLSPSFVSVTAFDMPNQNLSDVLGDYKYPTIRNLPSETQNVFATNKSGIFSTGNLDDSEVNEAFDSLLPELGSELDMEPSSTDLEASTDMPVDDSTMCYDDTLQSDQTFQREGSTESIDTKFVNKAQIFHGKNCCILVLKHPVEVYIHGKVRVTSLAGAVEIAGYTLQDKKCDVFAANYNCAHCLRTLDHEKSFYGLFSKLTGSGLSVATVEDIVTTLGSHDSIVQLQPLRDRVTQFVENNCTVTDLFTKTKNVDGCFRKASEFLGCSLYLMKPWKSFEENLSWNQVLKYGYKNQSRGIVCGGKGSGKSSFLRYYVNKLLTAGPVLVIDLDPGQCEFTVAGNVSATVVTEPLLGPSFTHLKTPERMLNIGLINTMDNTRRYATSLREIIAYCHNEPRFKGLPWIVNTMGMCNALGLQFMTLITMLIQPTFMLQIDSKNPKKRFDRYLNANNVKDIYKEYQHNDLFSSISCSNDLDYELVVSSKDSAVKNNFSLTPKDERYLNFLAYFGSLMNNYNSPSDFLLNIVPYEVDLSNLYIAVNVRVNEDSIARVINGKIVALCKHGGDNGAKMFTLTDKPLLCYGHGLIRGIDEARGRCYVVTPAAALDHVDALVYADWVPELLGPGPLPRGTAAPYRAPAPSPSHHQRLLSAPRRRYNPLQLLKMSRSPKLKASS